MVPTKPKRPCSYPGCPKLTDGRFCEEHAKAEAKRYEKYDRDPGVAHTHGTTSLPSVNPVTPESTPNAGIAGTEKMETTPKGSLQYGGAGRIRTCYGHLLRFLTFPLRSPQLQRGHSVRAAYHRVIPVYHREFPL